MKKRKALEDEKYWSFDAEEPVIYYNSQKAYQKVEQIDFVYIETSDKGQEIEFELTEISLPNLQSVIMMIATDKGKSKQPYRFMKKLQKESLINLKWVSLMDHVNQVPLLQWVSECKNLEDIYFELSKSDIFPFDLSSFSKLSRLSFYLPKVNRIPDTVFTCKSLTNLDLGRATNFTIVDDEIKNLTNLKHYIHCEASFEYISPNLFRLPNLEELNFSFSYFEHPPIEVFEAIRDLKQRKPDLKYSSQGGNWFREIWDQV